MFNTGFIFQILMVELTLGKLLTFLRGAAQFRMTAMVASLHTFLRWN